MRRGVIPLDTVIKKAFISKQEGNGCVFSMDVEPQNRVFIDRPLYSYIHQFSRKCAIICDHCYRPIGSIVDNINHIFKLYRISVPDEIVPLIESINSETRSHEVINCPKCDKKYCSTSCMKDSQHFHDLFCRHMTEEEIIKWNEFHRYCLRSDENLYFVGCIHASILANVISDIRTLPELLDELSAFYEEPSSIVSLMTCEADGSNDKPWTRVSEAFRLMNNALYRFITRIENQIHQTQTSVFTIEYFLLLLSKIELTAVEIEIENPLNGQLRTIMQHKEIRNCIGKELFSLKRRLYGIEIMSEELDDWELDLPDILGLGIYGCISKLNHSCCPNLEVEYLNNNVSRVRLLRQVEKGVQATISYVDESMPLGKRRYDLLKNYHFVCHCPKCLWEEKLNYDDKMTSSYICIS